MPTVFERIQDKLTAAEVPFTVSHHADLPVKPSRPGLPRNALPVLATVDFAPCDPSDDRRRTFRISDALTQPKRQSGHAS